MAEGGEAETGVIAWLGVGLEYGAEEDVVGTFGFGLAEFLKRMAGDADKEAGRGKRTERGRSGAMGGEMEAVGPGGESDVEARVDEDLFLGSGGEGGAGADVEFAGGEMLGAELEPVGGGMDGRGLGNLAAEHIRGCGGRRAGRR